MTSSFIHASCVALDGKGVLVVGPSGSGKSDLAVRLIHEGGILVADDQVVLEARDGRVWAAPPEALAGLIELRHVGLLRLPFAPTVPVGLYVELAAPDEALARLPEPSFYSLLDCPVRRLKLPVRQAATPAKIALVLKGTLLDV